MEGTTADLASIDELLQDKDIVSIGREYTESKNSQCEMPFNVFTMVSDLYYRENFHSDIIQAFLDPSGNHNAGNAFLYAFIDCLNEKFNKTIDKYAYQYATVEREVGNQESHIDILISSNQSKHCIIIENKINDAGDMGRQLPRYFDLMTERGFEVDAIVYIPLDVHKKPEVTDWSDTDKQNVEPRFCNLPAYRNDGTNLVDGWLTPCTQKTDNIDCISTLRQYAELVKHLNNDIMDSIKLEQFYDSLLKDNNLETAKSLKIMLNNLPAYMAERLCEYFQNVKGPSQVVIWKNYSNCCFLVFNKDNLRYIIVVCVEELNYIIRVYNDYNKSEELPDMKSLNDFSEKDGYRYTKTFTFLEEGNVKECVNKIIPELLQYIDNKK